MKKMCIYIHIPFCKKRCYYCSFISSENAINYFESYYNALKTEILKRKQILQGVEISSVFFGGGTPSFFPSKYIKDLMQLLKDNSNFAQNAEVSIEANPCTITAKKLDNWLMGGINRFSVGLQSSNDNILQNIGRTHTQKDFLKSIELLKSYKINNINADIMLGLPNQTLKDVEDTVSILLQLNIPHISAYGLKVEEGTKIFDMVKSNVFTMPDEDLCVDMYDYVYYNLKINNIKRYEVSNFAKDGYICSHNLNYWQRGEYAGFGVAAHSFIDNQRFSNINSIEDYIKNINGNIIADMQKILEKDAEFEFIMLGLRLSEGINLSKYKTLFKEDFTEKYSKVLNKLNNYVIINDDNLKISESGFNILNTILTEFVPD